MAFINPCYFCWCGQSEAEIMKEVMFTILRRCGQLGFRSLCLPESSNCSWTIRVIRIVQLFVYCLCISITYGRKSLWIRILQILNPGLYVRAWCWIDESNCPHKCVLIQVFIAICWIWGLIFFVAYLTPHLQFAYNASSMIWIYAGDEPIHSITRWVNEIWFSLFFRWKMLIITIYGWC